MYNLRQGKTKTIIENSRNSALTAVETYNRPNSSFRIENYIILMVVAWTKLFHAYFQIKIGEKYFYKEKNGRYKIVDGEKKAWELTECIKYYRKSSAPIPISDAVVANLEFFIGLRNKIEHRFWNGSELDVLLFGECQALLYNYENLLIGLFGMDYSINSCLAYALQFAHMRTNEQYKSQKILLSKDMQDIKKYIDKYKTDLSQEIYDSQEYSIKLLQIPKISNTERSDFAIEFIKWDAIDENDRENYKKITTIIKDKRIIQNVSNSNLLKPSGVIEKVREKTNSNISLNIHSYLWKIFGVRPGKNSEEKFSTNDRYCVYDEPHDDYLYTYEWVEFISNLYLKYGFNNDKIKSLKDSSLKTEDYK